MDEDCGGYAYVTGNGGGGAGEDDVDDGSVLLESPVFDATLTADPWIRYYRWWFTGGGNSTSNDDLTFRLDNGDQTVTIETLDVEADDMGEWVLTQVQMSALITPTTTMKFSVLTADSDPGHLVEAGLDRFEVLPASPFLSTPDAVYSEGVSLYPVPNDGTFTVQAPGLSGRVHVFDARGQELGASRRLVAGGLTMHIDAGAGLYMVRIEADNGRVRSLRMVVH